MTPNQEIANTILTQLGGANRLSMMTGAYNFVAIQNGLSFKIKNPKANYIKITLNGKDLYDLEVGRIRGNTYKVVHQSNDLYFDMLKPAIEKATGMYLSLFAKGGEMAEGGEIGHSVAVKKDFKKISQRDIDLFVDYCYNFYGKGGTYADDLNGGFTKAKVKSAVMKYIKNLGNVDTWGGADSMDRESVREILQPSYSKFSKGGKMAEGGGIKEDLPKKKRERLDYLQSQEDISSLTPMQNREYEALVREYRKTNRYKKAQLDKYSEGGSIGGFNYSIGGL